MPRRQPCLPPKRSHLACRLGLRGACLVRLLLRRRLQSLAADGSHVNHAAPCSCARRRGRGHLPFGASGVRIEGSVCTASLQPRALLARCRTSPAELALG